MTAACRLSRNFQVNHGSEAEAAVKKLQAVARARENIFAELMDSVKELSLGQISAALYAVGGDYRRNM
jgi:methylmalonyl-CoA mutase